MVTIDPSDDRSVEQASEMIDLAQLSAVVHSVVYQSFLRLKNLDLVGARFREITDRALQDFGNDAEQFLASLGESKLSRDEAQIRQCVYMYWIGLPQNRREQETLNDEFRRIVNEALANL